MKWSHPKTLNLTGKPPYHWLIFAQVINNHGVNDYVFITTSSPEQFWRFSFSTSFYRVKMCCKRGCFHPRMLYSKQNYPFVWYSNHAVKPPFLKIPLFGKQDGEISYSEPSLKLKPLVFPNMVKLAQSLTSWEFQAGTFKHVSSWYLISMEISPWRSFQRWGC